MGLARLERPDSGDDLASTLTQDGGVMGTPDFIAPEQARNSHTADIRADLYSLGCTLYYLLAGDVPFPGGTPTEKLLSTTHGRAAAGGGAAAGRAAGGGGRGPQLMAKKPEDRYQTPAEAAAALAPLAGKPAPASIPANAPAAAGRGRPADGRRAART